MCCACGAGGYACCSRSVALRRRAITAGATACRYAVAKPIQSAMIFVSALTPKLVFARRFWFQFLVPKRFQILVPKHCFLEPNRYQILEPIRYHILEPNLVRVFKCQFKNIYNPNICPYFGIAIWSRVCIKCLYRQLVFWNQFGSKIWYQIGTKIWNHFWFTSFRNVGTRVSEMLVQRVWKH